LRCALVLIRFQLSLRDIEELLFRRGMTVTYETIRCWCDKFGKDQVRSVAPGVKRANRTGAHHSANPRAQGVQ
jgi:transposase-like protein